MITNSRHKIHMAIASLGIILAGCNSSSTIERGTPSFFLNERGEISATDIDLEKASPVKYFFTHEPYIHPNAIKLLVDYGGVTEVPCDLFSNTPFGFNFYNEEKTVEASDTEDGITTRFEYRLLGTSPSGIHILHCRAHSGGSEILDYILFLSFQSDKRFEALSETNFKIATGTCLKNLGVLCLGDRYDGEVKYTDNILSIDPDERDVNTKGMIMNIK